MKLKILLFLTIKTLKAKLIINYEIQIRTLKNQGCFVDSQILHNVILIIFSGVISISSSTNS
jgi:hypothetical protein